MDWDLLIVVVVIAVAILLGIGIKVAAIVLAKKGIDKLSRKKKK